MSEFSTAGHPVTELERKLIESSTVDDPDTCADLWVSIGKRIGVENLVIVLDEFGAQKPHVPTREMFFRSLYRPHLDALIVKMHEVDHLSLGEIGRRLNKSKHTVHRALARCADAT